MTDRWGNQSQKIQKCREDKATNDSFRESFHKFSRRKDQADMQLRELKSKLRVATSKVERTVDHAQRTAGYAGSCILLPPPSTRCLPGAAVSMVRTHNRQNAEIASIRKQIALKQSELESINNEIAFYGQHSRDVAKRYSENECFKRGTGHTLR